MIFGSGVDIVEVYRMKDAIDKWGDSFLKKIFTCREIKYSNSKRFSCQHFAARFAAKEAIVKAFGEPRKFPIKWTEIEVMNDGEGKPTIRFYKDALKLKNKKRIGNVMLSISHSRNYAIANVILLKDAA
ncbi:MAG: holo-ACP synthase [Candidatus Omnitrophota bacterium]